MIKVERKLCEQCGLCVKICPFRILEIDNAYPSTIASKYKGCLQCMHCIAICPVQALSFENIPAINEKFSAPSLNAYGELKTLISSNRSIRRFSDSLIPIEEIKEILGISRFAPSAKNQHQNQWILVYNKSKTDEIMSSVLDYATANHISKEIISEYAIGNNIVTLDAPHLLFGIGPKEGSINPYTDTTIALADVDLLFHAKAIGSCWAGYLTRFSNMSPRIKELIGLDGSMQVYGALAFGYPKGEKYERLPYREEIKISVIS